MTTETIITILSLLGTLCGSFGGIIVSSKLTSYRIEQLERKVDKLNSSTEKMPVIEEQIKVINHRLEDLEHEIQRQTGTAH
jgi:chaperonin cofactor prefoldin